MGKSGPDATSNLFFLGWGWPWVGEFVVFTATFIHGNFGAMISTAYVRAEDHVAPRAVFMLKKKENRQL